MTDSVGRINLDLGLNYNQFKTDLKDMTPKAGSMVKSAFGKVGALAAAYFSLKALANFGKGAIELASDLTEVQNVVDVTFGSMSNQINQFAKESLTSFGLSELSAKKYSSTMGAMLKSSGLTGQTVTDVSIAMTKLSADMASFYNLSNEAAFDKIRSGISGQTEPLKQLGINMNVANLEAYALSQGIKKSYDKMSQAEQVMLRYNYLLKVTADAQGDFARNSDSWANQTKVLSEQWKIFQGIMGQGFINILQPVVKWLNVLMAKLQIAAKYFQAFTALITGQKKPVEDIAQVTSGIGSASEEASKGMDGVGKSTKKAGKSAKNSVAGFDQLNTLLKGTASGADDLADTLSGSGDMSMFEGQGTSELDVDISKVESKFKIIKDLMIDLYDNWGAKDLVKGIREGLDMIDFSKVRTNISNSFKDVVSVAKTAIKGLQPVFQEAGKLSGTMFKYGIGSVGNIFESITTGFANFTNNMRGPVESWILETTGKISGGLGNLTQTFDIIGSSWLDSIMNYKDTIAERVEDSLTNYTDSYMLIGEMASDTFERVSGHILDFVTDNADNIQKFTDDLVSMFDDCWELINKTWKDSIEVTREAWREWGDDIIDNTMQVFKDIGDWFFYLWDEVVKPLWDYMLQWINKVWDENFKDVTKELTTFVGKVNELLGFLWKNVFQPVLDLVVKRFGGAFKDTFKFILDFIGVTVSGIGEVIENLLKMLNGIIDFLLGAFTGDWERAWKGISKVFEGIAGGLVGIFKVPLNWIITSINNFLRGLNRIKIPEWVPGVGGKGFSIPEIPMLARGGIIDQPTLAMVGEKGKEAVVPLEDTSFVNTLANAIANAISAKLPQEKGSNNDSPTEAVIYVGETELGRAVIRSVNKLQRQTGETLIVF